MLTPDEEVELAKRIKEGDQIALEKLTKANLRFVVSVAKQYQNQGLSLGDLINEGNLGLIKAAQRFDETRGFKFISYAVWWIRQSILQALAEQSRIVRLPLNRVGSLNKISKTFSEVEQKYEREPSPEKLAEVLDVTTAEVVDTMKISGRHVSMDAPFVQGEENSLLDVLERKAFNKELSQHQAIQFKLAEMATKIDAARLLVWNAAYLKDENKDFVKAAAQAKLFASQIAQEVTTEAVQIHGGYGYVKEYHVERLMRDAKITQIYEGTTEIQKMVISRELLRQ